MKARENHLAGRITSHARSEVEGRSLQKSEKSSMGKEAIHEVIAERSEHIQRESCDLRDWIDAPKTEISLNQR